MAQTGYTPIQLYQSSTTANVPTSGSLLPGELAINTADGKLFYKDSGGTVQVIASKSSGLIGGANTYVQYNNANALAGSANLTFNGTTLGVTGNITVTNVYANSGTIGASLLTGTLTTAAQGNITSLGTLTSLSVTGNISGANITGTFYGAATGLTSIPGGNVTGQVANALVAGTVYTAAQTNITSLGTLTSLGVTGNISAGNVSATTFTGALSGAATTLSGNATNWGVRTSAVSNMLGWKNYGNSHVIFDASQGTSPTGSAVNNTNPATSWTATYPTLMGWNGTGTYGVRVDSARYADTVTTAAQSAITSLGTLTSLTMSGIIVGATSASTDVNTANDTGSLSLRGNVTTVASMSFHRAGAYAINMGLGTDNIFRIGGWSASANAFQMTGGGNLTMLGTVTATSDERLKKDWVQVNENFVNDLSKVKSGIYTRTDIDVKQVGVSAQSLQPVMPEAVLADNEGMLSVAYGSAALVACIELAKEIVALKNEIAVLKGK